MKNVDMEYICTVIGNLAGMPVRLFIDDSLVFQHSIVSFPKDPMDAYRDDILNIRENVGYFMTRHFSYYGIVNSGNLKFVIGPTRQTGMSAQELKELAFRADVRPEDTEDFIDAMKSIVAMPFDSVIQMLCTVNYILNDEKLGLEDITIHKTFQDNISKQLEKERSEKVLSGENDEDSNRDTHSTYAVEQRMLRMVRKGDTAALKAWIASAPAVRGGVIASDQLRQLKNTFVVTATLVSRAAISGSMEAEDAFYLSDKYIRQCELMNSVSSVTNLQYHMVLDFAERVERLHSGGVSSPLALSVRNYILHHMSEPVTAESIAAELYLSRPYLSSKFKKETGETITDFILKEKAEEAKRLLRYSDKSAIAISTYLGFSSPGHFSRVFKKYTGFTPMEYREKYIK